MKVVDGPQIAPPTASYPSHMPLPISPTRINLDSKQGFDNHRHHYHLTPLHLSSQSSDTVKRITGGGKQISPPGNTPAGSVADDPPLLRQANHRESIDDD